MALSEGLIPPCSLWCQGPPDRARDRTDVGEPSHHFALHAPGSWRRGAQVEAPRRVAGPSSKSMGHRPLYFGMGPGCLKDQMAQTHDSTFVQTQKLQQVYVQL
jgi:hypothetical protein